MLPDDGVLNASRQPLHRERLDHYLHARLEVSAAHDGVLRVARAQPEGESGNGVGQIGTTG